VSNVSVNQVSNTNSQTLRAAGPGASRSAEIAPKAFTGPSRQGAKLHWPVPQTAKPALSQNEIHLWCAHLEEFLAAEPEFWKALSYDERSRAQSFQFHKDRDAFVIQWGLLRHLLSRYLPVSPAEHKFAYRLHGKPELVATPGTARLHFNISHSGSMALYALTRAVEVGVDIEHIRPMPDLDSIALNFFAPHETATLRALPAGQRLEAFFNCWTRKEAILKATGQGISEGVDGVEVTLVPGELAHVLRVRRNSRAALDWSLHALQPADGYAAALAYLGRGFPLQCWTFLR